MKISLSEIADNACYQYRRRIRKKLADGRTVTVGPSGKVSTRALKGDPKVTPVTCPLKFLGVGLRRHPATVVEIGDGNILKRRRGQ